MKNLNMIAPIGSTGYGIAALNILKELSKIYNISLFPIGNPGVENQEEYQLLESVIDNQESFDFDAYCLKIWHQFDLALHAGKGPFVVFPFFELDTFTDREKHHLSFPDKLIVSSEWAKSVIENNNINRPVSVAPLGVDRLVFNENKVSEDSMKDLPYVFLTVGKWEIRKGHDIIIELFNEAFTENDNVELWMVTENPFLNEEQAKWWTQKARSSKLGSKIRVFSRLKSHENVAEVMSFASCGIFMSRGEGWNLELLEMMSMGKPVIATNFSSHTEFCDKDNAYLIDITETELAVDGKWFHGQGNWAKITADNRQQCIDYMKHVYSNGIKFNQAGIETAKKFSWTNSANIIHNILEN